LHGYLQPKLRDSVGWSNNGDRYFRGRDRFTRAPHLLSVLVFEDSGRDRHNKISWKDRLNIAFTGAVRLHSKQHRVIIDGIYPDYMTGFAGMLSRE
jgi:hypothetical protein